MYFKVLVILAVICTVKSKFSLGFYLQRLPSIFTPVYTVCLAEVDIGVIGVTAMTKGRISKDQLTILSLSSIALRSIVMIEFGSQLHLEKTIKEQYREFLSELHTLRIHPVVFINVQSLRTGANSPEKAVSLIRELHAMGRNSSIHTGIFASKYWYNKIFGHYKLAEFDILLMESIWEGFSSHYGGYIIPDVTMIAEFPLPCLEDLFLPGIGFLANLPRRL